MRSIDDETLKVLEGSRPADVLSVFAWRDGSLVLPDPLQVISANAKDDAGENQKVNQRLSLTVADPDGTLGAWRLDDPLGVAGTELQIVYRVGGAGAVNFGWFRIVDNEPTEMIEWREIDEYGHVVPDSRQTPHTRMVSSTRAVVKLELVDRTFNVDQDRLDAPQNPSTPTRLSEFARLTQNYFPTVVDEGVEDKPVSRLMVFERERLDACQDLVGPLNARYRMGGDGECHIYPRMSAPVWRVEPGNGLVSLRRRQSVDGLYNCWVVKGKDSEDGRPVQAVITLDSGPLRYGGPHGRVTYFYDSEMITDYSQAAAYGVQLRDEFLGSLAVEIEVQTIPRPELQAGDWIEVGYPVAAGHVVYFPGPISSIDRTWTTVPTGTRIRVQCAYMDVVAALSRTDWAKNITDEMPPLTWDRLPGSWGSLPAIEWGELPE